MRNRQRARSVASLYLKQYTQLRDYEPYGCTMDSENIPNWLAYIVFMMGKEDHKLIKVII